MKKELMLIVKNGGIYKINSFMAINHEIGKNAAGIDIDTMTLTIKINGIKGFYNAEITARDYNNIISEINTNIKAAYKKAANNVCNNIKAGYQD